MESGLNQALDAVTVSAGPDLGRLCRWFEEAEDATDEARRLAERDRDYYDGKQWTQKELDILKKRGQPALTVNYVQRKVNFLRGLEQRQRTDPKAFPRTPHEEQLSEAATDALRFVADQNRFDDLRSEVYENMLIEGFGGVDVTVVQREQEYDVDLKHVPWDRIFYDPHSRRRDFEDVRYKGIVIWMDRDEALEKYPNARDAIEGTLNSVSMSDTYDDRPKFMLWCDNRRTRVRIVQMHYLEAGQWWIVTFTKGGILEEAQVSPYLDKYGKPTSSLILRAAYVDRDNARYGDARSMISLQDEINKRRSKALHLMSVRQTFGNERGIPDVDAARRELAKPDGHVKVNQGGKFGEDFGILPTNDMAQGQQLLLQQATAEMQAAGPNAAMAGKDPRQQSGRAIQAQQQGGSIEVGPINDGLRQWCHAVYEAIWMRVRQFWTDERWIRVTDDERNVRYVGLNRKVTLGDVLSEMPPEQAQQVAQRMQLQPGDPRLQEVVRVENEISGLDVDIVIEETPDTATIQSEQFEMLVELARTGVGIPPKALVQASSIRNKDAILEEMEKGNQLPPQVQEQIEKMQQAIQQGAERMQQMEAQLRDKQGDLAIKAFEAETRRAALSTKGQQPVDPVSAQIDAEKGIADIRKTNADAQQTEVETALLLSTPAVPEFRGSVTV